MVYPTKGSTEDPRATEGLSEEVYLDGLRTRRARGFYTRKGEVYLDRGG
jgi:hypothetical protein